VYIFFAMFVMVGCDNAVNLTDGVDGLSSSVTLPVMVFFTAAAVAMGKFDLALLPASLTGGLIAYLFYNWHPAKVFMGDTGSLFLGGVVCALAFALDMPLILILVGFVYICETLSVILQVGYFKLTHGKRLFKMSPIHHHFEMCGWKEEKIVLTFAAVSAIMCVIAWFGISGLVK
jgi:phospho-N-acetylmuramoyl-pentapeptide-transferase